MGVKGFATWLARTYPECFVPQQDDGGDQRGRGNRGGAAGVASSSSSWSSAGRRPDWSSRPPGLPSSSSSPSGRPSAPASFDHVYVDMASLLHTALRQGKRGSGSVEWRTRERENVKTSEIEEEKKLNLNTLDSLFLSSSFFQRNPRATSPSSSSPASTPCCGLPGRGGPSCSPSTGPLLWPSC